LVTTNVLEAVVRTSCVLFHLSFTAIEGGYSSPRSRITVLHSGTYSCHLSAPTAVFYRELFVMKTPER
jgi:hypothetical protein